MIRATTGGVLRSYRANLMNSFISQNKARNTVLSQRNFNSYAEDPASAAKAFRLRKSRMMVQSQYSICNDTYFKYQQAFASLQGIDEMLDTDTTEFMSTLKGTTLEMLNDPTGDAREQLNKVLDQLSEAIVQNMNQKYGDNFVFAGADGHNVPFEIKDEEDGTRKLYYRGVPVDATVPDLAENNGTPVTIGADNDYVLASSTKIPVVQDDGMTPPTLTEVTSGGISFYVKKNAVPVAADPGNSDYVEVDGGQWYKASDLVDKGVYDENISNVVQDGGNPTTVTIGGEDYYIVKGGTMTETEYNKEVQNAEKLEYLKNEKLYVDIGLGFQENENGELIASSAFDASIVGINFFGYGMDEDGDPKNIFSLVQKMKEVSESVAPGEKWNSVWPEFNRLVGKFEDAASNFKTEFTNLDAGTTKLKTNVKLLEDNFYSLQEQYGELEDVDMADAITSFVWAQYCYNAALKVGNSILSESLMDYLN